MSPSVSKEGMYISEWLIHWGNTSCVSYIYISALVRVTWLRPNDSDCSPCLLLFCDNNKYDKPEALHAPIFAVLDWNRSVIKWQGHSMLVMTTIGPTLNLMVPRLIMYAIPMALCWRQGIFTCCWQKNSSGMISLCGKRSKRSRDANMQTSSHRFTSMLVRALISKTTCFTGHVPTAPKASRRPWLWCWSRRRSIVIAICNAYVALPYRRYKYISCLTTLKRVTVISTALPQPCLLLYWAHWLRDSSTSVRHQSTKRVFKVRTHKFKQPTTFVLSKPSDSNCSTWALSKPAIAISSRTSCCLSTVYIRLGLDWNASASI